MKKIYLGHPISTTGEFNDSIRITNKIKKLGFKIYAPALNSRINNKSNNPTPEDIYIGDITELLSSDIAVFNLTGGHADGTITEIGFVAGYNEASKDKKIEVVAYTSNARLSQPQFHKGIPSASANHLTLGAIEKWGEFVGSEENMLGKLKNMK